MERFFAWTVTGGTGVNGLIRSHLLVDHKISRLLKIIFNNMGILRFQN